MPRLLFQNSIQLFKERAIALAEDDVRRLAETELTSPHLLQKLDDIVSCRCALDVARLGDGSRAERRQSDDRESAPAEPRRIEFSIPFVGDAESLHTAPSAREATSIAARVICDAEGGRIIVSLDDCRGLDETLASFIGAAARNLDALRAELSEFRKETRDRLQMLANHQLDVIQAQRERDKTRGFSRH